MSRLDDVINSIKATDKSIEPRLQARLDNLTKPQGSLGMLEVLAKKYGTITNSIKPVISNKQIFTFAGDHGVAKNGVSLYPAEVTPQMVLNFARGGAGVNVLAKHVGAKVNVVDIGVDYDFEADAGVDAIIHKKVARGTKDFTTGAAMSREQAVAAIVIGIELAEAAAENGADIIGTGDMGIGNTTPSSAIVSVICRIDPDSVTGNGTGISDETRLHKIAVIKKGISVNNPDRNDPVDLLAKVGGFEIAGIAGLILGAAANGLPVVVDGFISSAGALIAYELNNNVADYLFASHKSVEVGHGAILERIGLTPVLDLGMRLGEGTGACLAMTIIESGVNIMNQMATFGEAGVSEA